MSSTKNSIALKDFLKRNKKKLLVVNNIIITLMIISLLVLTTINSNDNEKNETEKINTTLKELCPVIQPKINTTLTELCPIIKMYNNTNSDNSSHFSFFRIEPINSVSLSLCFSVHGPVIELRSFKNGMMDGRGIDLNPYQFRLMFNNSNNLVEEIECHIDYIPH
jgi:hypothetical protein